MKRCLDAIEAIRGNISRVIRGKKDQIDLLLSTWFAGGHALIEDNPGTGKTMLARSLAKTVQLDFKRVQFTPDLLPSDIVGASVYDQASHHFEFYAGPIFTTILLADEINRGTPRTQSALLEAMAEKQVTVEGTTRGLNRHFFVIATQNPVEQYGTFPLPEAQLDRFMVKFSMGYPPRQEELALIQNQLRRQPIEEISAIEGIEALDRIRLAIPQVRVDDAVYEYLMNIVQKTRQSKELAIGASPRAAIALTSCAQARALMAGRVYVRPTDIFHLVQPVLAHRLVLTAEAKLANRNASQILAELVQSVSIPKTQAAA